MKYLLALVIGVVLYSCSLEKEVMKQAQYGNFTIFSDTCKIEFQVLMTPLEMQTIAEKRYYWYNDKKIHKTYGGYSGKLLHGKYVEYFRNGELKSKGTFLEGLKDGNWRTYHQGGNIQSEVNYNKGDTSGVAKVFSIDGIKTEYHKKEEGTLFKLLRAKGEEEKQEQDAKKAERKRLKAEKKAAKKLEKAQQKAAKKKAKEEAEKQKKASQAN